MADEWDWDFTLMLADVMTGGTAGDRREACFWNLYFQVMRASLTHEWGKNDAPFDEQLFCAVVSRLHHALQSRLIDFEDYEEFRLIKFYLEGADHEAVNYRVDHSRAVQQHCSMIKKLVSKQDRFFSAIR
jgi:hypothetical protein